MSTVSFTLCILAVVAILLPRHILKALITLDINYAVTKNKNCLSI